MAEAKEQEDVSLLQGRTVDCNPDSLPSQSVLLTARFCPVKDSEYLPYSPVKASLCS